MTNLTKLNNWRHVDEGMYLKTDEYKKALAEDRKNTVERHPEKKWILDPFVGYIEKKEA